MKPRIASLCLALLLALSLVPGSAGRGGARADPGMAAAGLTELVLCSDGAEATILIDAQGNVVDPGQPCPRQNCAKCLGAGTAVLAAAGADPSGTFGFRRSFFPIVTQRMHALRPARAVARGPPSESQIA